MSQSLQAPVRSTLLRVCLLVVLTVALLLSLSLFLFSAQGALHLSYYSGRDPNGVANGSMINPDGVARGSSTNPDGLAAGSGMDGNGLTRLPTINPGGGALAAGVMIDGNG